MSTFRKRGPATFWSNDASISDKQEALDLLAYDNSATEQVYLAKHPTHGWEIVYPWYRHGDSGGDRSGYDYFQIEEAVADVLVTELLVVARVEKFWGGSRTDENRQVLSDAGRRMCREFFATMEVKADSMLKPGVHTDLTGKSRRVTYGRDEWRTGKLYFDYRTPPGDICRVYPEQNRLIYPWPQ